MKIYKYHEKIELNMIQCSYLISNMCYIHFKIMTKHILNIVFFFHITQ